MYLVDDKLMELILQRTDPRYLKLHARLSPSMEVVSIEDVAPTLKHFNFAKMLARSHCTSGKFDDSEVIEEDYNYDYDSNPVVTLDDDNIIHIYHPYKKRK